MSRHDGAGLSEGATPPPTRPRETPSSTPARERSHAPAAASRTPDGSHGREAALKFVGRVAQLDLDDVAGAVATWRQTMRTDAPTWFAAEEAVGRAVVASGRHGEQKPLLMHVADAFAHVVWYGGRSAPAPAPELRVRASEASGQYLATLAMLAVLVRDHLEPATFALLYQPFARHIALAELGPE